MALVMKGETMKDYNITDESAEAGLEAFCLEFAQDRIEELPKVIESLNTCDYTALHEYTHKWIGFSEPYGFLWLADAAAQLKAHVKDGNIEEAKALVPLISSYLSEKEEYIKKHS